MLHPYNILFPYEYEALSEDVYLTSMMSRIKSFSMIINSNTKTVKNGVIILPCTIQDIDSNTFIFIDGLGNKINTEITKARIDNSWVDVSYTGPIDNTDSIYSTKGSVVFLQFKIEPVLYNKTITGTAKTDGKMFSLTYYERLEFLYNSRLGCKYVLEDQDVKSFDKTTGKMVTSIGEYTLEFPLSTLYKADDKIPKNTFIDKAVSLVLDPPYIKVVIKKDYSYIRKIFTFDSNKIIEFID